jgi:anti-sigma factor RsiW
MTSAHPLEFGTLVEYWLGELDADAEARIDEHLLGCDACGARLDEIMSLASGVREAYEGGAVHAFVTEAFVQSLARRGVRLAEYNLPRGGSVNCTVHPEDQVLVARLQAPLQGVSRIDAILGGDAPAHVFRDIPFEPRAGAVVLTPSIAAIRSMPSHRAVIRLVAMEEGGERVIGDYTFFHSRFGHPPASIPGPP